VATFGRKLPDANMPNIPGLVHHTTTSSTFDFKSQARCDIIESRPTFILSNDDIFNLGHYSNDVMNVWNMLVLANVDSKSSLLINIDGYRVGGPAGGPSHRMMVLSLSLHIVKHSFIYYFFLLCLTILQSVVYSIIIKLHD
jgi:hypothetical protein